MEEKGAGFEEVEGLEIGVGVDREGRTGCLSSDLALPYPDSIFLLEISGISGWRFVC